MTDSNAPQIEITSRGIRFDSKRYTPLYRHETGRLIGFVELPNTTGVQVSCDYRRVAVEGLIKMFNNEDEAPH